MIPEKIKTLWLPSWYPSKISPVGNFIQRHAESAALYCEVTVLFPVGLAGGNGFSFELKKRSSSLVELIVYYPKSRWKFIQLIRLIWAGYKGYQYFSKESGKPDLLHLHVVFPTGFFALLLSWFYRLPLVVTDHWTGYRLQRNEFKGVSMRILAKFVSLKAAAFITYNSSMESAMRRCGLHGKYYHMPNVVNSTALPVKPVKAMTPECNFIHVSSLFDRHKNITGILRAVKKLAATRPVSASSANRSKRPDFHLTIIGGDEETALFVRKAAEMGISHLVHFTGMLPHTEVMRQMAEADVFVLFSNFEGLPCVVLEALGVGLPVICTEIGGMHEWITPETGILIDIGDEDALVDAMDRMIDTHRNYDSQKLRQIIRERCSYEVVGKQFGEIYRRVLSKGG